MANRFITADTIVLNGYAVDLTVDFDDLYVGANASVGTEGGGIGVRAQNSLNNIFVAGHIFGPGGISYFGNAASGTVTVYAGGSVTGTGTAINFDGTFGQVNNAGTIAGSRGIYSDANTVVTNSGSIIGQIDALFILGDGTVVNTGLLVGNTAVYVVGQADISNYGTIRGGVNTQGFDDTLINRGTITGTTQTGAGDDLVDGIGGRFEKGVFLGAGNDKFIGGDAADVVNADIGNDDIDGGGGNDRFLSLNADGNDSYDGGAGIDIFDARIMTTGIAVNLTTGEARNGVFVDSLDGMDYVFGGAGSDRIAGDANGNLLRGAAGNDVIAGLDGNDWQFGDIGNDGLTGGNGNDRLFGGEGVDSLNGGAGNDQLTGSFDIDLMTGGTEADRFIFTDLDEFFGVVGSGLDRITDFQNSIDLIDLSALDARFNLAGDQAFTFIGTAAISAFGQLNYRFFGGNTIISIGFNTPTALDVIQLDGLHTLTAADFIL
jgi:serralysin